MPQLAIETYFTQYFWLLVIFFLFNDFILNKFVPAISTLIKIRKFTTSSLASSSSTLTAFTLVLPNITVEKRNSVENGLKRLKDSKVTWISKTKV
jgi:hypothetical protein